MLHHISSLHMSTANQPSISLKHTNMASNYPTCLAVSPFLYSTPSHGRHRTSKYCACLQPIYHGDSAMVYNLGFLICSDSFLVLPKRREIRSSHATLLRLDTVVLLNPKDLVHSNNLTRTSKTKLRINKALSLTQHILTKDISRL